MDWATGAIPRMCSPGAFNRCTVTAHPDPLRSWEPARFRPSLDAREVSMTEVAVPVATTKG